MTKLALELFVKGQKCGLFQINITPCKWPLNAKFPNLYYGNSHLDYYWFCQQCKNYFKNAKAKEPNKIPFVTLFFCRLVIQ